MAEFTCDKTGMKYNVIGICTHCGHKDDLENMKHILFDSTGGNTICPNPDCDALDDAGFWISFERI